MANLQEQLQLISSVGSDVCFLVYFRICFLSKCRQLVLLCVSHEPVRDQGVKSHYPAMIGFSLLKQSWLRPLFELQKPELHSQKRPATLSKSQPPPLQCETGNASRGLRCLFLNLRWLFFLSSEVTPFYLPFWQINASIQLHPFCFDSKTL